MWHRSNVDLDLRVLATFLAAVDLWIKYSWGIIVVRWPFSLPHNITYSLLCIVMLGFAMSVNDSHAWLLWGVVFCVACSVAYFVNALIAERENRLKATYAQRGIVSEDRPYTEGELDTLRSSSLVEGLSVLFPAAYIGLYTLAHSLHITFAWLPWNISWLASLGWGGFATCFVIVDILYQGLVVMPKQRYTPG